MAISGAALFLFVIGHLLGNLQVFLGREQINAYGNFLHTTPEILWPARLGLLAMVALHIWSAVTLSAENKAARPMPYANWNPTVASYASRTMLMSGLIIGAFVIYHLLHFTVQAKSINFTGQDFLSFHDARGRHDVYRMLITGFSYPIVSGFYVLPWVCSASISVTASAPCFNPSAGKTSCTVRGLIASPKPPPGSSSSVTSRFPLRCCSATEGRCSDETPNTKHRNPEKLQTPITQQQRKLESQIQNVARGRRRGRFARCRLAGRGIGAWDLEVLWCLELGIWCFVPELT